ncbi:MAG: glycoside hydrolase family 88 protein, partial [Lachnospiraceae bacterium]|nr:glycoside hydrolase family 88 protein [Lachnospiraceae bacterium]
MKPDQRVMDYIDGFLSGYKNYKENWNYEDGCVLIGAQDMYEAVGDTKYVDFIEKYLKGFITDDGEILKYNIENYNIDNILSGRALYFMYD